MGHRAWGYLGVNYPINNGLVMVISCWSSFEMPLALPIKSLSYLKKIMKVCIQTKTLCNAPKIFYMCSVNSSLVFCFN